MLQPYAPDEAAVARARSEAYGRCNGDMLGACILLPDGGGKGVATVEQLALQRDPSPSERAACAARLLERALEEATARRQRWLVVRALPNWLQVEGSRWLEAAGFRRGGGEGEVTPEGLTPGAAYKLL